MEQLPSFIQAVGRENVWDIIATYVDIHDYHSFCLVSKDQYSRFAPMLWKDPLQMAKALGNIDPSDEHGWMYDFVLSIIKEDKPTRPSTLAMLSILDFRALRPPPRIRLDGTGPSTTASVCELVGKLPNLRCLILDGRTDFEPHVLLRHLRARNMVSERPLASLMSLSMVRGTSTRDGIPYLFFDHRAFAGLVDLDLSDTGWGKALVNQACFSPQNLPNLRCLKLRSKGLDGVAVSSLLDRFGGQLRSLDISSNPLNDIVFNELLYKGFHYEMQRRPSANSRFEIEGALQRNHHSAPEGHYFIESARSANFSHPDRYLADSPPYTERAGNEAATREPRRLNGIEPLRHESTEEVIRTLAGGPRGRVPEAADIYLDRPESVGLTHVYLNDLQVTAKGLRGMMSRQTGYVEHLECDRTIIEIRKLLDALHPRAASWLSRPSRMYGFPGAAHLLRPALASNLRSARLHHSLVTNVPTLDCSSTTGARENVWLAETLFRERIDLAFPQTFTPDMNPRLCSLTLTHVPPFSRGVVAERLIGFLERAAIQEQSIVQFTRSAHHRGPPILRGLRHIRLEFAVGGAAADESRGAQASEDIDQAMAAFDSLDLGAWDDPGPPSGHTTQATQPISSSSSETFPASVATTQPTPQPNNNNDDNDDNDDDNGEIHRRNLPSHRLSGFPYSQNDTEYHEHPAGPGSHKVKVWIGTGVLDPATPSINAYMRNVAAGRGRRYTFCPQLATSSHHAAGVPPGATIYGDAWDGILVPVREDEDEDNVRRPTAAELRGVRDVLQDIKAFRAESRDKYEKLVREGGLTGEVGQHVYWKGKLEIAMVQPKAMDSDYWE